MSRVDDTNIITIIYFKCIDICKSFVKVKKDTNFVFIFLYFIILLIATLTFNFEHYFYFSLLGSSEFKDSDVLGRCESTDIHRW